MLLPLKFPSFINQVKKKSKQLHLNEKGGRKGHI